jgi:hypothetical protein
MSVEIELRRLTESNFSDFESITNCEDKGCFCAFWHQKWDSVEAWDKQKETAPERNRETTLNRIQHGFHVGVLAYRGSTLLGWISVAPVPEFYWAWRRVANIGESAKTTACVPCLTRNPKHRNSIQESELLISLQKYGKSQGWTALEGYPFDQSAIEKYGDALTWPGVIQSFQSAGFERSAAHWLSNSECERSIYSIKI